MKPYILLSFLTILLVNCKAQSPKLTSASEVRKTSPYSINDPDRIFEMPKSLQEISGLTISPNGQDLCAINDEHGVIFFINKNSGEVEREVKFHKNGDYEGIETVGKNIYIVKSTGTLYKVMDLEKDSVSFKKGKYLLKKENDTEGLGYDPKTNNLLFACKGRACLHSGCRVEGCMTKKSIYSMDLNRNRVSKNPLFEIEMKTVQAYLKENKTKKELQDFHKFIGEDVNEFHFHPSALAIHPITQDIYILASKGKTMMVLNQKGQIKFMEKLKKKIHAQPEGIAFDNDGTMFISNEGKKDGKGKVYVFKYQKS